MIARAAADFGPGAKNLVKNDRNRCGDGCLDRCGAKEQRFDADPADLTKNIAASRSRTPFDAQKTKSVASHWKTMLLYES